MSQEIISEDSCDDCGETVYYGSDGICCEWIDLAVEHECDSEWTND